MPQVRAVVIADVVSSRSVEGLREIRDQKLAEVYSAQVDLGWVEQRYAVTAGDEFQNIIAAPSLIPGAVFDLRWRFRPLDLWIAVGIGLVDPLPTSTEPINVIGMGEAFERARQAMHYLRGRRVPDWQPLARELLARKYKFMTAFRSGDDTMDTTANIIYRLIDALVQRVTPRQWETIRAYEETGKQDLAASRLELDESTVSRNLSRGFYWQMLDSTGALATLLERRWH